MSRLLTTVQLAEQFGLTTNTLRVWRLNGEGPPFYKLGDAKRSPVRYDADKVAEWLTTHEWER